MVPEFVLFSSTDGLDITLILILLKEITIILFLYLKKPFRAGCLCSCTSPPQNMFGLEGGTETRGRTVSCVSLGLLRDVTTGSQHGARERSRETGVYGLKTFICRSSSHLDERC